MKYIIPKNQLADLNAKLKYFLKNNYKDKYYQHVKKRILAYLNLCDDYYLFNLSLKILIKKYFKGVKKTFYNWSKKILKANQINCFSDLKLKYCPPKRIKYFYDLKIREQVCNYYYGYRNISAGGALALFHDLKKGVHGQKLQLQSPKNLLTFYRWIRKDERWEKFKQAIKKKKQKFKRYEVSELGLLQMDAKVLTVKNFPVFKNQYVYDFIDEKTRIVFGYVYDCQSVTNAIDAVARAIYDFKKVGIKIKRIRTDNGTEFINTHLGSRNFKTLIKERPFTVFLNKMDIAHQTTPIRSPQSNGKIERFHQHYAKLFWFYNKKLKVDEMQFFLNEYYYFYNFKRCHKSLNFKTPIEVLKKFQSFVDNN